MAALGLALFVPVVVLHAGATSANCDPNYQGVCLPVYSGVDDINCDSPSVTLSDFPSTGTDPYKLDDDHDGIACDKNGRPAYVAPALTFHARAPMLSRDQLPSPPTPTPTPTLGPATATPRATSTVVPNATSTQTTQPSTHTWYTSTASNAKYYYCDLDDEWKSLSPSNLRSYSFESDLIAVWGSSRTKFPSSHC